MLYPKFIRDRVIKYKTKTVKTANDALDATLKVGILTLIGFTIIWISIFLYVAFYYTYVPSIQHVKPVNLQFEPCEEKGICSFPSAHIQLTKSNQILMVGQPYKVLVELDMPDSPVNKELGMFMVCGRLAGRDGVVISHSCRSAILRYSSPLVRTLTTLTFAPLYISGTLEEKQTLLIELFSNHEEDQTYPVTDVYVEIKSQFVEVYSSKLYVNAHLSGLRYLMFNWPIISALFGISFNLLVILFMVLLSWWQLYAPYLKGEDTIFEKFTMRLKRQSTSPSNEEVSTTSERRVVEVVGRSDESDKEEDFMAELKKLDASTDA